MYKYFHASTPRPWSRINGKLIGSAHWHWPKEERALRNAGRQTIRQASRRSDMLIVSVSQSTCTDAYAAFVHAAKARPLPNSTAILCTHTHTHTHSYRQPVSSLTISSCWSWLLTSKIPFCVLLHATSPRYYA